MVDGLIWFAINLALHMGFGNWGHLERGEVLVASVLLVNLLLGPLIYFAINGPLIEKRAQTVGKIAAETRVVRLDGTPVRAGHYIFARWLPIVLLTFVPFLGGLVPLIDALLIFRREKNCLHDDIAKTRVVVARDFVPGSRRPRVRRREVDLPKGPQDRPPEHAPRA